MLLGDGLRPSPNESGCAGESCRKKDQDGESEVDPQEELFSFLQTDDLFFVCIFFIHQKPADGGDDFPGLDGAGDDHEDA